MIRCVHIHLLLKNKEIVSRFLVMQQAYKYGIKGSVQKKGDDAFFIVAEGEEESLYKFVHWCETFQLNCPDCISMEEGEILNYKTFDIIKQKGDKL